MKIYIEGVGLFSDYSNSKTKILEIGELCTVISVVKRLRTLWGEEFYNKVIINNNLAPYVIILLNGLSIKMKEGLETKLKNGDRLVFSIMVNGG